MRALVLVFLVACGQSSQPPHTKPSDSTLLNLSLPLRNSVQRETFHITSVHPQFADEPGFREFESFRVIYDLDHFYSYSIYNLSKRKVEELLAKRPEVKLESEAGKGIYVRLEKMPVKNFLKQHVEQEELQVAGDFYDKALRKNVEVYAYYTGTHFQYLFFDSTTNMVYHRLMAVTF